MSKKIDELATKIHLLEIEFQAELEKKNSEIRTKLSQLDGDMRELHNKIEISAIKYIAQANILFILTAPVIYSLIIAFVLLDVMITIYQHICFRVYKIPLVKRKDYLQFDRATLKYLNIIQKLNCAYCSYGNGIIAYAREISARTEKYWCPIKHESKVLDPHQYYRRFLDFGEGLSYNERMNQQRTSISETNENTPK